MANPKKIPDQSLPKDHVSMEDAINHAIDVLRWLLNSDQIDIAAPQSDEAWRRLQVAVAMLRVAINPEQFSREELWNSNSQ